MPPTFPGLARVLEPLPQAFPGAAIAVAFSDEAPHLEAWGRFTYSLDSPRIRPDSIFDLASLTKVIASTTMAMVLHERGRYSLEQPLVDVVPEFPGVGAGRDQVTLRMLLAHTSGLPPHRRYFESCTDRDALLAAVSATPLSASPGDRVAYSDLGFILLGTALERIAGEPLDSFCAREIFAPLGMAHTRFNPPPEWKPQIPPTLDDRYFRHRVIQGEVNDENAYAMGGVASHAGLFAPAADVARFAQCMLRGGSPILRPTTLGFFTQCQTAPAGTSRALGWDTPSPPSQSGRHFSPAAYGHLGFTGTSLWIDPVRGVAIVFLTNRTWPDAQSQAIKQVRPAVHDAMMEALLDHADTHSHP